jgi:hypothetical protein
MSQRTYKVIVITSTIVSWAMVPVIVWIAVR